MHPKTKGDKRKTISTMPGKLLPFIVIFSLISSCFSQDDIRTPTFPEVFQTQIEGTFVEGNGVVGIDASMFFDRPRNRAALFVTKEGGTTKFVYNFEDDESLTIMDNSCDVQQIPAQPFFSFKIVDGKKKLSAAAEILYFTKSELDKQSLAPGDIPTLVYRAKLAIPQYGQQNCDLTHVFSKPDFELATCKEGEYCDSTLITLSVRCKDEENTPTIDHVYRFSQFRSKIDDESVFLPPPGIHCEMKNTKEIPDFPPYFSFTFDIAEMPLGPDVKSVFNTHKEVWYDSVYRIIRIDEYGTNGLLYSSKILDQNAGVAFTIIATNPTCDIGPISYDVKLDEITRLPKSFFTQNDSSVYVGKRNVHGLDYDVWSLMWTDSVSEARVVEEVYYLQIDPDQVITGNTQPYFQLSHVDMYTYEETEDTESDELTLLKHFSINNYRSKPKEWAAFDVATCFDKKDTKPFSLKVEGPPIVKGSQSYREVLEQIYDKIIKATGVSVVRISELEGIFDGLKLLELKGLILDNSENSDWPKGSKEPGMEETYKLIEKAASDKKLFVNILDEYNKELSFKVTIDDTPDPSEEIRTPTFPEIFQTQIEGTFVEGNGVVGIDVSMFFDRPRNRAALFLTKEGGTMKFVYNFEDDESLTIDGNSCNVQQIPAKMPFFAFKTVDGKKKLSAAAETLYFTKSELDKHSLAPGDISTLVYKANVAIPQYGQQNCDLTHVFSKPDFERATCKEGENCDSTIITLTVRCKNEENTLSVDHVYRFSQFRSKIDDESVFLPPPGIHCEMKNTKEIPEFPPYFSFTFDIDEMPLGPDVQSVFNTHKEVWYDSVYKIIRIDEFGTNGLLYSSRIRDQNAGVAFTIIATNPTCDIGPISYDVKLDEITRLPKSFFTQNDSSVYVGKRNVHGLDYDVWSRMWTDSDSEARVVEEVYYLQIDPDQGINGSTQPYYQLSHVDMYTYEEKEDAESDELTLLKHFSINNYRSKPKEWAAFDVATCFDKKYTKPFSLKVEGPPLVKGSQSYREVLEQIYNKIIKATGVSVVRISELEGIFDGLKLLELKGLILDNSESSDWPKGSKEPGMEETYQLIQKAASDKKLFVNFLDENNEKLTVKVTSIEETQDPSDTQRNCYSGSSMAAASLVLLIIGILFGVAGYYVFLKKRKPANIHIKMSDINS